MLWLEGGRNFLWGGFLNVKHQNDYVNDSNDSSDEEDQWKADANKVRWFNTSQFGFFSMALRVEILF